MSTKHRSVGGAPLPPQQYNPPSIGTPPAHHVTHRLHPRTHEKTSVRVSAAQDKAAIPFLFGTSETEGGIRFAYKRGVDLWLVRLIALGERSATARGGEAAGQLDSLISLKTDDGKDASDLKAHFRYWVHNGSLTQTVDPNLANVCPTWDETLIITNPATGEKRAIAYSIERYINYLGWWKENGGLPRWRYRWRGSRVLNTTTGVTAYSENLFWQWRYWSLDPDGLYLPVSDLSEPAFQAAAAIGDQAVAGGKRYATHFKVDSGQTADWLKMFRLLGDAYWFQADDGKWNVLVDRPAAAVASYSDLHYTNKIEPSSAPPKDTSQLLNKVEIEFTDTSGSEWKPKSIALTTDEVDDGLEDEVSAVYKFPEIHDEAFARRKLNYLLYGDQDDYVLTLNWRANTLERKLGDVVAQEVTERAFADNFRLISRDIQSDGTANVDMRLMSTRKYADDAPAAAAVVVGSTLPDRFAAPDDVTVIYQSPFGGVVNLTWQPVAGDVKGYEARVGSVTDTFDTMGSAIYRGDHHACTIRLPYGTWKVAIKAFTDTTYSANAAEITVASTRQGPALVEASRTLQMNFSIPSPIDRVRIGDYLVIDGVNVRQTLMVSLDNSKTVAAIDAEIVAGGYATVGDWLAGEPNAQYAHWGPLPDGVCIGEFIDVGSYTYGTAYRNQRVKFRIAAPVRIGVNSPDAKPTVEALLVNPSGSMNPPLAGPTVAVGPSGWSNRFGARLSTNHPYAQAIVVSQAGAPLWFYTAEQIPVLIEQAILTTNVSGVATRTLSAAMGSGEVPDVALEPFVSGAPVIAALTSADNTSFAIKVVDAAGAAAAGVEIRCTIVDNGRGGSIVAASI